eukprot:1104466-Rhodomonas_salina.1
MTAEVELKPPHAVPHGHMMGWNESMAYLRSLARHVSARAKQKRRMQSAALVSWDVLRGLQCAVLISDDLRPQAADSVCCHA